MDRKSALACVTVCAALILTALVLVTPHQNRSREDLDAFAVQSAPADHSDPFVRTGFDLEAAYNGESLSNVITSGWVDVESGDDVLVSVSPHSYVSLPSPDWKSMVGRPYIYLRMNDARDPSEYVLLELSERVSANEVIRACEQSLNGKESLADTWMVKIRASHQP